MKFTLLIVNLKFYVNGSIPISYEDWMHESLNFLIHRSDDGFWPGRFHMLWYNLHVQVTACIDIIQYVNTFIIPMSNELHENIIHSVCWHSGFAVIWGRSCIGVEWGWMGALGMLCMDRTIKLGACVLVTYKLVYHWFRLLIMFRRRTCSHYKQWTQITNSHALAQHQHCHYITTCTYL